MFIQLGQIYEATKVFMWPPIFNGNLPPVSLFLAYKKKPQGKRLSLSLSYRFSFLISTILPYQCTYECVIVYILLNTVAGKEEFIIIDCQWLLRAHIKKNQKNSKI